MDKFTHFNTDISKIELPEKFTFPFYYEPHPLAIIACEELQYYLLNQSDFEHNFGLNDTLEGLGIGKMFGVLVVENKEGRLGYLSAFSGKLADSNHHERFVPPVYDVLVDGDFYKEGEKEVSALNTEIEDIESSQSYIAHKSQVESLKALASQSINDFKALVKSQKKERDHRRSDAPEDQNLAKDLKNQSLFYQYSLKDLQKFWEEKIGIIEQGFIKKENHLNTLKSERKSMSNALQHKIFEHYRFLNAKGDIKNLKDIFPEPPAGSGECAAPKLLHYAYLQDLKPIALAEFWWGTSPPGELRKHKHYYPACKNKCEPILGHMLQGLDVDDNPLLVNQGEGRIIDTIYEDEYLVVVNKPAELLSQPGRYIKDCVQSRMKSRYPDASGPLIVHRLDMSTSGLMLIAKSSEIHTLLQRQFIDKTIRKRYVALLDGRIDDESGIINLPLRVDLEDRPRQMVCYEHGKTATTKWEKIDIVNDKTRIYFYPITGRTHQLRVHAAHHKGLNTPIVGDDLYGQKSNRLHLHAESLTFVHPISKKEMTIVSEPEF